MTLKLLADFFTLAGDLLIAISIFKVHSKLSEEKSVDQKVIYEVRLEKKLVIIGSIFLFLGFILENLIFF